MRNVKRAGSQEKMSSDVRLPLSGSTHAMYMLHDPKTVQPLPQMSSNSASTRVFIVGTDKASHLVPPQPIWHNKRDPAIQIRHKKFPCACNLHLPNLLFKNNESTEVFGATYGRVHQSCASLRKSSWSED